MESRPTMQPVQIESQSFGLSSISGYDSPMPTLSDFPLGTVPGLLRAYDQSPRRLAFQASTLDEAHAWQAELRATFAGLLGQWPTERCDLDPHRIETVEQDHFTRELV